MSCFHCETLEKNEILVVDYIKKYGTNDESVTKKNMCSKCLRENICDIPNCYNPACFISYKIDGEVYDGILHHKCHIHYELSDNDFYCDNESTSDESQTSNNLEVYDLDNNINIYYPSITLKKRDRYGSMLDIALIDKVKYIYLILTILYDQYKNEQEIFLAEEILSYIKMNSKKKICKQNNGMIDMSHFLIAYNLQKNASNISTIFCNYS